MDTGTGSVSKRPRGRPRMLTSAQVEVLIGLARDNPTLSLLDMVSAFRRRTGLTLSAPTVQKYLREAGFHFQRPAERQKPDVAPVAAENGSAAAKQAPKEYGYCTPHRDPGDLVRYPCGLTDSEWEQVKHIFDPPGKTGRPPEYPRRQMLDGCIYVLRSGCSWRMLPKDFPSWTAVYQTFRRWQARDLFEALYDELRKLWRTRQHRAPDPTGAILDSQSVRTSPQGGPKGFDAGKKIKGRKRHLVTDTLGNLVTVVVTPANKQDRDVAVPAMDLAKAKAPSIQKLYVDNGYAGAVADSIRDRHHIEVDVVRNPGNRNSGRWQLGQLPLFDLAKGFVVLPKRWVIERTNAWNDRPRRMNKDHDRNLGVSAAWIWLTGARMLLRRLTATATVHG